MDDVADHATELSLANEQIASLESIQASQKTEVSLCFVFLFHLVKKDVIFLYVCVGGRPADCDLVAAVIIEREVVCVSVHACVSV